MKFTTRHALLALALVAAAPIAPAQCPNMRAENREGHWVTSTTGTRCRRVLVIFGAHIGLGSSFCPDVKFWYPARRDCRTIPDSGTDCETVGQVALERWECECTALIDIDLGIAEQDCRCEKKSEEGLFDDHQTVSCSE